MFSQPEGTLGWVYLTLGFRAADGTWRRDKADISYAYCPFQALMWWMEALVRRVPRRSPGTGRLREWLYARKGGVLIDWEDEGSEVYLLYLRGRLLFKCKTHQGWWRLRIPARDVATAFYRAFRHFLETGYDRSRYERVRTLREVMACNLDPHKTQTSVLASISRLQLRQAIGALEQRIGAYVGYRVAAIRAEIYGGAKPPDHETWLRSMLRGWPTASRRSRIRMVRQVLATRLFHFGSETHPAGVRSRMLERFLAHERRCSSIR